MRKLLFPLLLSMPLLANAKCLTNDKWHGEDKQLHALVGMGIGFYATLQTSSPMEGFLWGAGIGLVKEAVDAGGLGQCSLQDLLITAAASALGASLGNVAIRIQDRKVTLLYRKEF